MPKKTKSKKVKKIKSPLDKLSELTPADISEALERGLKRIKNLEEERNNPKEKREGSCRVCGGKVIGEITRGYHGDPMFAIIGPGSSAQYVNKHHGWHCTLCGIKYKFPPPAISNTSPDDPAFIKHEGAPWESDTPWSLDDESRDPNDEF
jgi:hypothetical protein